MYTDNIRIKFHDFNSKLATISEGTKMLKEKLISDAPAKEVDEKWLYGIEKTLGELNQKFQLMKSEIINSRSSAVITKE